MNTRALRLEEAERLIEKNEIYSQYLMDEVNAAGMDAGKVKEVRRVDRVEAHVIEDLSGKAHIVHLEFRQCTCKKFQENGIPCLHALALINILHPRDPIGARKLLEGLLPDKLTTKFLRDTYLANIPMSPHFLEKLFFTENRFQRV